MKKSINVIITILIALCLHVKAADPSSTAIIDLSPGVTNINAASTTDTTAGAIQYLPFNGVARTLMVQARCAGIAATTNGVTASSNVVFRLAVSIDGTNFTDASTSPYKVTVNAPGATTNWNADWFYLPGVKAIRIGRIENNTQGSVSNFVVWGAFNY